MNGLPAEVREAIAGVLARHPAVARAILFGSRAKGVHEPASDIDLALDGEVTAFEAASIAQELADLPWPYAFDVQALSAIQHVPLREHIARVGKVVYERGSEGESVSVF